MFHLFEWLLARFRLSGRVERRDEGGGKKGRVGEGGSVCLSAISLTFEILACRRSCLAFFFCDERAAIDRDDAPVKWLDST